MNLATPTAQITEPAWEIAHLFPEQGMWSVEEYLALDSNHLVEYTEGTIEVLPMPTDKHQAIVAYLYMALLRFTHHVSGIVRFAPLRLMLWPGKFREPDILFLRFENNHLQGEEYWTGADLVIEVISPANTRLDTETKRREYALAGIPEYWIVDPVQKTVTVLGLAGNVYAELGVYRPGQSAKSSHLMGFELEVDLIFAAR